jgi:hypothetical protein
MDMVHSFAVAGNYGFQVFGFSEGKLPDRERHEPVRSRTASNLENVESRRIGSRAAKKDEKSTPSGDLGMPH